ncbi:peptidase inhibitor family I36 protein [Actinomadura meridiana]
MAAACPSGWYCFYESKNFGGRRLQFRDCGGTQYLTNYGFGNQTTSWQNTTKHTVYVYDNAATPPTYMWTEEPTTAALQVGETFDDRADSFYTGC